MSDGDLAIVYNGEIYNHLELRRELEALGHQFRGHSDTEVLLKAWRQWGPAVLPRLGGMFAFGLWDGRDLIMARDRFGKKPLIYAADGARLAFASDLAALERLEGTRRPVDPVALRLYFALRFLPEPWSIVQGAHHLAPGHLARFSGGGLTIDAWAEPTPAGPYRDEAEAGEDLRARFDAAVARRLVADVPVGAYLSGGIDSGLVTASMARQTTGVKSFTVGFAGVPAYYEERPAARAIADHLGLDHTWTRPWRTSSAPAASGSRSVSSASTSRAI
jgi:asparagine synthase (glutamine-hydrolysing)